MKRRVRFPLMAKMLVWLCVHLGVLAAAFYLFVSWQLRLGLDSLLSGTAGERLKNVGEEIASDLRSAPRRTWPEILAGHEGSLGLDLSLQLGPGLWIGAPPEQLPANVDRRIKESRRPQARPPRGPGLDGPPGDRRPGMRDLLPPDRTERPSAPNETRPRARPDFLLRGDGGNGYWAGIDLPLFEPRQGQPLHGLLVIRAAELSGGGLFFDLKPWIFGGLAVLGLSLILWVPVFFGITRYLARLSRTTESIADGKFDARVGISRSDELGRLGDSIESMASRLDRLVRGQKRFLADVAHELCSPLARIRTGLGVLEHGMPPEQLQRLESIEEDVGELSRLVSEVLAFTKASTAPSSICPEVVELAPLVRLALSRECPGLNADMRIPEGLAVLADKGLLARAVANVLRNANLHAGGSCTLAIAAACHGSEVELRITDDGPGVDPADLPRLFEPFYRPDAARTREAGGVGLGLSIVRAGIEACGGTVHAEAAMPNGLSVVLRLPPPA